MSLTDKIKKDFSMFVLKFQLNAIKQNLILIVNLTNSTNVNGHVIYLPTVLVIRGSQGL